MQAPRLNQPDGVLHFADGAVHADQRRARHDAVADVQLHDLLNGDDRFDVHVIEAVAGQNLELRGVPAGIYLLVHRANPEQRLEELDYTNNDAALRISLTWSGDTPRVQTLRTCQASADC